ncbi:MAG: hypothetical protein ACRD3J_01820, partial [Thermoanaerobaculia bacterium]
MIAYHGYTLTAKALPVVIALLLWMVIFVLAAVWPRRKRGWTLDVLTVLLTIALGVIWQQTFYATPKVKVAQEIVATCPPVEPGTHGKALRESAGAPDRIVPEEETRGPGATVWVYD